MIVALRLTESERSALHRQPAVNPDGLALATCTSSVVVERGARFVVWTVLAATGGEAGDVRRFCPPRPRALGEGLRFLLGLPLRGAS